MLKRGQEALLRIRQKHFTSVMKPAMTTTTAGPPCIHYVFGTRVIDLLCY